MWLGLLAVVIIWDLIRWFADSENSVRYEYALHAVVTLFYSLPAVVGVLLAGIVPKTGLSVLRRLGGIGLLLLCIIVFLTLDYLQATNR